MATAATNFRSVLLFLLHTISLPCCVQSSSLNISSGSSLFTTPAQHQSSHWLSPSGNFAFGFYPLNGDARSFVVGIWLVKTIEKTLVWVANRDDPPLAANGTSLLLTRTGKLVVRNRITGHEKLISSATGAATRASMLDSGNFVLYNSESEIIWESFNHPTHTVLSGQILKTEQELFSLASETSPATGRFRLTMKSNGNLSLYRTNPVRVEADLYWEYSSSGYEEVVLHLDSRGRLSMIDSTSEMELEVLNAGENKTIGLYIYRATIDTDGNFRLFAHGFDKNNTMNVTTVWSAVDDLCEVKGMCGSDEVTGFFKVGKWQNTTSPSGSSLSQQLSANLTQTDKQWRRPPGKWFLVTVVLASVFLAYVAFSVFWILFARSRIRRYQKFVADTVNNEVCVRSFTYRELYRATGGFGVKVGEGGSGAVYRGTIFGDVEIAVKKLRMELEGVEHEFRREINIIGRTHHKNLVRLLGYCREGSHLLLIYEFMSNGSLADLIFNEERRLQWGERLRISLCVARGLRYLHEECETQIIHCDVKPSNILLSDSWVPKISDFGLSELLKPDVTQTFMKIRGTRGYVAPEWWMNVPMTAKVDVYSFGVMLLEIICCEKNADLAKHENEVVSLTDWADECFASGKLEKLVAEGEVQSGIEKRRLERMVKVALWCIQDYPSLRPSMKMVILMMEGTVDVLDPPRLDSIEVCAKDMLRSELSAEEASGEDDSFGEIVARSRASITPPLDEDDGLNVGRQNE